MDLIKKQTLASYAQAHDDAQRLFAEGLNTLRQAEKLAESVLGAHCSMIPGRGLSGSEIRDLPRTLQECRKEITRTFWANTIRQTGIADLMAPEKREKLMAQLHNERNTAPLPEYTLSTLISTLQSLTDNLGETIVELVKHVYGQLAPARSRLKTNKAWEVGPKAIYEHAVCSDYGMMRLNHYRENFFSDLDKVFHLFDGKPLPKYPCEMTNLSPAISKSGHGGPNEFETEYFRFQWFKVGTMHIYFKRLDLLEEFNRVAATGVYAMKPPSQNPA